MPLGWQEYSCSSILFQTFTNASFELPGAEVEWRSVSTETQKYLALSKVGCGNPFGDSDAMVLELNSLSRSQAVAPLDQCRLNVNGM